MKISLVQTTLHWQDRKKNLAHFSSLLQGHEGSGLIVLPEMFSTGFTMEPEKFAEVADGETLQWMKEQAKKLRSTITGSVSVSENGKYFNRLFWVEPNGKVSHYNKRHLFRMGKEDQHYTAGVEKLITEIDGFKFCPLVCYDLRFPVWSRNKFNLVTKSWDYDVLLYVANWPEVRSYAWKSLLVARAIENQCYVVGVNRTGKDGNNIDHAGDSMVIGPKGETLLHLKKEQEGVFDVELDQSSLKDFREHFPVGMDADSFRLEF